MAQVQEDLLPFLAVGRVKDAAVVAVHSTMAERSKDGCMDVFKKLLGVASKKLKADEKTKLSWEGNLLLVWVDQQADFLYMAMSASPKYPERLAYQLLSELDPQVSEVAGIQDADRVELETHGKKFAQLLKNLADKYQDASYFPQLGAIFGLTITDVGAEDSMNDSASQVDERLDRMLAQKRVGIYICMGVVVIALIAVLLAVFIPETASEVQPERFYDDDMVAMPSLYREVLASPDVHYVDDSLFIDDDDVWQLDS